MADLTIASVQPVPTGAEERTGSDRAAIYDVSQRSDVQHLRKHAVGLGGVLFLTVTGSAPISAMLFNVPISVGYGNGVGTPAGFIFAGIVLVIFSVGYTAMTRKITAAGGFYSFISHGLGQVAGTGTALAAVVGYSVFEASLAGGFAYFLHLKLATTAGVTVPWEWCALFMVAVIAILAYYDIRLSAKVLGVFLVCEVLILLAFDGGVFGQSTHVSATAVNLANAFKGFPGGGGLAAGGAGVGIFFAFWSWVGFEMAPNYGEESRNPKRNVALALYISVIGLGVFYTLTSWAGIAGYSSIHDAAHVAQKASATFYFIPAAHYLGHWAATAMSYLIITGSFACGMAFHNTASRYFYSLGRERVLPAALGKTHHRWKSPHVATITQSVIAAIIVGLFALFVGTNTPTSQAYTQLYGLMAVMGVIIIVAVQALVSVAIWRYFRTHHPSEHHMWKTVIAPLISFVAQAVVLYLLFDNLTLIGGGIGYANIFGPIDAGVFLVGIGAALYLKRRDPARFDAVGRLINEGV